MKILVDTNVVLDVLLARQPFVAAAARIFELVERSRVEGLLCATTVTTVHYLLSQHLTAAAARQALRSLLRLFHVAPVNRAVLEEALRSKMHDFEDAVIEQSARLAGADAVVTRNQMDFRPATLDNLGPDEFLAAFPEASHA